MAEDFFRVKRGLSVANSSVNVEVTPVSVNVGANVSMNLDTVKVGANMTINTTIMVLGNSTVNATINSTALRYQNSTVSFTLSLPTAADQASDDIFLHSNGSWVEVIARATVANSFADPESGDQWYNTDTGAWLLYVADGDTNQWVRVNGSPGTTDYENLNGFTEPLNAGIAVSASANTLTISLRGSDGNQPNTTNVVRIPFRSSTQSSGGVTWREVSSNVELTLSEGSTLGFTNATAGRIWVTLFNDAGTVKLGAFNATFSNTTTTQIHALPEWGIASATAEGGAGGADSVGVHYANSTISSKAFRILGFVEWANTGLTEAGKWTTTNLLRTSLFSPGMHKPGDVVQHIVVYDGEVATGSVAIPLDDTTPSSSEGNEVMSANITPTSAANILNIKHEGLYAHSTTTTAISLAIFRNSDTSCLGAAQFGKTNSADTRAWGCVESTYKCNLTTEHEFKIRAGAGGAGTLTFNGISGSRQFNGRMNSYIKIQEIMG